MSVALLSVVFSFMTAKHHPRKTDLLKLALPSERYWWEPRSGQEVGRGRGGVGSGVGE